MSHVFETVRLLAREWGPEDAGAVLAMCGDPEVMLYIGDGRPWAGVGQARAWIERTRAAYASRGWGRWAVVERASGLVVGSCGFGPSDDACEIDFGYMFARAHWGKGYATEAARACVRHGFERLGFEEVMASVDPRNRASARVLEKVGFECRGLRRFGGDEEGALYYVARRPAGGAG